MTQGFGPDELLPDAATDPVRLPRRHGENSAQGLAVTLLGDYNLRRPTWLPSGAVLDLLAESGLTPAAARTTISRLARRGVLETARDGRRARYRLAGAAATALARGGRRIASFVEEAEHWDGRWTLVAFRLPQEQDAQRRALRGRLRWLGYAPLYDALWVSPAPLSERAATILAEFGPGTMTSFRADLDQRFAAAQDPLQAWDLEEIAGRYHDFLLRWEPVARRVRSGEVADAEAVQARTAAMDSYRQFMALDPPLPMRVMPDEWPRTRAHQVFAAIYDGLADVALAHVRELVARHDPGGEDDVLTHSLAELRAGLTDRVPSAT